VFFINKKVANEQPFIYIEEILSRIIIYIVFICNGNCFTLLHIQKALNGAPLVKILIFLYIVCLVTAHSCIKPEQWLLIKLNAPAFLF